MASEEPRVLGASYCGGIKHTEEEVRPANPAAIDVALQWHEGRRHISVVRAYGRIVHPRCEAFSRDGTCSHVRRAIALAERPGETFADDVVVTWGTWGMHDPTRWAAAVRREADQVQQRIAALARHHQRSHEDREVERLVSPFVKYR